MRHIFHTCLLAFRLIASVHHHDPHLGNENEMLSAEAARRMDMYAGAYTRTGGYTKG